MEDKTKIVVICGPTATGKTDLSLKLAKRFNGEIISADSMQVYKKLDIGTAKATKNQLREINHHLVDILNPMEIYSVRQFVNMSDKIVESMKREEKLPFVVGGTGLYIESLINGINFKQHIQDKVLRSELISMRNEKGNSYLHNMLCDIDPEYSKKVHKNNVIRVARAIEIFKLTGKTMTENIIESQQSGKKYDALQIALTYKDRSKLYKNIDRRVDEMVENGLITEAESVYLNRDKYKTAKNAIGYKEFFPFFEHEDSLENCINKVKSSSRHYAKRQLTWFKRMPGINWLYVDCDDILNNSVSLLEKFYF